MDPWLFGKFFLHFVIVVDLESLEYGERHVLFWVNSFDSILDLKRVLWT